MRAGVRVLGATAILSITAAADAEVIVRGGTARYTADIVDALTKEVRARGAEPKVCELTGRFSTDQSRCGRLAQGETTFFAVGPHATALAGVVAEAGKGQVISLGVPNPERVQATATYVAFYPRLEPVLRWLAGRFTARTFGFVYTPSQNAAVASAFADAARAAGVTLRAVPAASSGELVRGLKSALAEVDVLLCPVDPLLFDRESLRIVIDEAAAAKKPVLGFLPDMPQLGFTAGLVNSPEAVAKTAWQISRTPAASAASRVQEVDGPMLYVTTESTTPVDLSEKPGERRRR